MPALGCKCASRPLVHTSPELSSSGYGPVLSLPYWVWMFLTGKLTNQTRAIEDVLREKEGKKNSRVVFLLTGLNVYV